MGFYLKGEVVEMLNRDFLPEECLYTYCGKYRIKGFRLELDKEDT